MTSSLSPDTYTLLSASTMLYHLPKAIRLWLYESSCPVRLESSKAPSFILHRMRSMSRAPILLVTMGIANLEILHDCL